LNYWEKSPVIITRSNVENKEFITSCEKERLLNEFGEHNIVLSSANSYSYRKLRISLRQYVEEMMSKPQSLYQNGESTFYHFGDNDHLEFAKLFQLYKIPYDFIGTLSWGLAASNTGVPFHTHGAVFAEVIHGRKRWFLYPPGNKPKFEPNETTLKWVIDEYGLSTSTVLQECILQSNEVLYIPSGWWHSTLNIGQSVFISTFL